MSAFIWTEVRLFCDRCGKVASNEMDLTEMSVAKARKIAKANGWKVGRGSEGTDLCPSCRDAA